MVAFSTVIPKVSFNQGEEVIRWDRLENRLSKQSKFWSFIKNIKWNLVVCEKLITTIAFKEEMFYNVWSQAYK